MILLRILLSNDDGIDADGIKMLATALGHSHEIITAAPMRQQSGMAHALSVNVRIKVAERADFPAASAYAIDGTPTDCVKLYLEAIADVMPDVVISGINHGANLGTDVLYSGTVGAAMEGYLHGISSIAVSLPSDSEITMDEAACAFADMLPRLINDAMPKRPFFYNVNFPDSFNGHRPQIVFTRVGNRDYKNAFQRHVEPDGSVWYIMKGEIYDEGNTSATDVYASGQGLVSVTPLMTDLTDIAALDFMLAR